MSAQQPAPNTTATTGTTNNAGGEDYLDKGLDKVEHMFGQKSGHNIDSNKMRGTNEKITDKIRGTFEKVTGKHVPDKVSN